MSNVHLLPEGNDTAAGEAGDYLLRPCAGEVEVGRNDSGGIEWLGKVPADSFPSLPSVDSPQQTDDQELVTAVRGVVTAFKTRGG